LRTFTHLEAERKNGPIPEKNIVFLKKKRILVDYNTAICGLRYAKAGRAGASAWRPLS